MIIAAQCRMARSGLGWSIKDLAGRSKVSVSTIHRFETDQVVPIGLTIEAIQRALEAAGVEFIDGGARLREGSESKE
jgi:transcriptional regulator with XRE-family HTH domain